MWLVIQRGSSYVAGLLILCSYFIASPSLAGEIDAMRNQKTEASETKTEQPGVTAEQGKQNLQHIRDSIRQYTRTPLTRDTDLMFDHNSIRLQSRFRTTDITTEFSAAKNGEINLRIKIPF